MNFYKETFPVAKKQYKCEISGRTIQIGEKYAKIAAKHEADFFCARMTIELYNLYNEVVNKYKAVSCDEPIAFRELSDEICSWIHNGYLVKTRKQGLKWAKRYLKHTNNEPKWLFNKYMNNTNFITRLFL